MLATQVPEKGVNVYALAFLVGWLRGLGWKRLLFRSDNERALRAFLRAAAMGLKGVEVIEQACPERDHKVNGLAEVTVREVKAQIRVLKSQLEERLKRPLEWTLPLATWLVRHSANCLSRYTIQADGKTPDPAAHRKTMETSSCRVWKETSISSCRSKARVMLDKRCGENG